MESSFWKNKWQNNEIAFHGSTVNPLLVKYINTLSLSKGSRLFLPLCGKTLDIKWLLSNDYRVVGAELVESAVIQLFSELGLEPKIERFNNMLRYSATHIDVFVGDIFELSNAIMGDIDAIYDRAALVALPDTMRVRYTSQIMKITHVAPQLLIAYVYDQNVIKGPPFSTDNDEIIQHYDSAYQLTLLDVVDVMGGLKGKCAATENVWLLIPKKLKK